MIYNFAIFPCRFKEDILIISAGKDRSQNVYFWLKFIDNIRKSFYLFKYLIDLMSITMTDLLWHNFLNYVINK